MAAFTTKIKSLRSDTHAASMAIAATLLLCLISSGAFAAPPQEKITSAAVWQIPANFVTNAHKACDSVAAPDFSICFINQMTKAGASEDAVNFTHMIFRSSEGEVGILTGFHAVGPVDIGWVTYPLRANTNYGLVFLNGKPEMINVEDMKRLDHDGMENSFQFQDLKKRLPNVNVWPGDRDGTTWPQSQTGDDGGLQFTVGYPLINGCHACEREGFALFNWNFDSKGKFKGTQFIGMTPAPLN